MTIEKLIYDLRYLRKEESRPVMVKFLMELIGKDQKYDYVGNKFRARLRKKVGEL